MKPLSKLDKQKIPETISLDELEEAQNKTEKINIEIEKIIKNKKLLAGMDITEGHKLISIK